MSPLGARVVRSWVWTSARDTSAMPDHPYGGWCVCVQKGGEALLCKVVDDGFGWFEEVDIYDDAGLVVDDADLGWFLAVFGQTLCRVE